MKKIGYILLVFILINIMSSFCIADVLEEQEPREGYFEDLFTYEVNNDGAKTCTITGYGDVYTNIIPNTINDYTVTRIGDGAFKDKRCMFGSIILPDTIKSIGNEAFSGCTQIKEITFGDSLTTLGDSAFFNCTSIDKIIFNKKLESIGNNAFSNCIKLANGVFVIPEKVSYIGENAFKSCHLHRIKFDYTEAPRIEENTFSGCTDTEILVPKYGVGYTRENNWPDEKIAVLYGDITKDNVVDAVDAITILTLFKNKSIKDDDMLVGDVDDNGVIDAVDAATILARFKNKKGTIGNTD